MANIGVDRVASVVSGLYIGTKGQNRGFSKVQELDGYIGGEEKVLGGDISDNNTKIVNIDKGTRYFLELGELGGFSRPILRQVVI